MTEKRKRYRVQHRFWLDVQDDYQDWIDETIHKLKAERTFSATVRDGIRLMIDLRNKRLEALFDLFGWVEDWLEAEVNRRLAERKDNMQERIERLELMLMNGQSALPATNASGPKALPAGQLRGPRKDEDEDDLALLKATARKDMSTDSAENFLKSMMNLQAGFKQ